MREVSVPVATLALWYRSGETVDVIVKAWPELSEESVHEAIDYSTENAEEIERDINSLQNPRPPKGYRLDSKGIMRKG